MDHDLIERVTTLCKSERFREASELVADADVRASLPARILAARVLGAVGANHQALLALGLAAHEELDGSEEDLVEIFARTAELFGAIRARARAHATLEAARGRWKDAPRIALAEARLAMDFDDRDRAVELFAAIDDPRFAEERAVGLATVEYARGGFAAAEAALVGIDIGARRGPAAMRLRSSIAAARGDFRGEAAAYRALVDGLPEGDRRPVEWLNVGFALAAAGDYAAAKEKLVKLARAYPDDGAARYARSRADRIEVAGEKAVRKTLVFPTTQQKRNYCGPASLELCFRYLGIELTQDDIAAEVKEEHGTTTYEMVRFLEAHDVVVRRIVSTAPKLKKCIDLGLPVILEEEYSTTFHVAVATGYDESLDVLIMNDPMTHRISTRPMGWAEGAGKLQGSGAIVIVGKKGDDLGAILAELDAAGVVDAPHLRTFDAASKRRVSATREDGRDVASPAEVLQLADRAIELEPHYRLAWLRRWRAKLNLLRGGQDRWRDEVLADLYHVRSTYADEEWPHQLHGEWLYFDRRPAEAFCAYFEAHRRDEDDGNNLAYMADCKFQMGLLEGAEKHALAGLRGYADEGFAEWVLAVTYLRTVVERDEDEDDDEGSDIDVTDSDSNVTSCDDGEEDDEEEEEEEGEGEEEEEEEEEGEEEGEEEEDDDDGERRAALVRAVARKYPTVVHDGPAGDRATLLRKARFFAELSILFEPGNAFHHETAGLIALRDARWEDALAELDRALALSKYRAHSQVGRAVALEALGRADDALELLGTLVEDGHPFARDALAGFHERRGDAAARAKVLAEAIAKDPGERKRFIAPLYRALKDEGTAEEAAEQVRQAVLAGEFDAAVFWEAASVMEDDAGAKGAVIALLRHALEAHPDNEDVACKLGVNLVGDLVTRDEGVTLLEDVVRRFPQWAYPVRTLALALAQKAPERALELLAPLAQTENAWLLDAHAMLLAGAGRAGEAEKVARRAIASMDAEPCEVARRLAAWHTSEGRYDRALYWTSRFFDMPGAADPEQNERLFDTLLYAHRLSGRVAEILPLARSRCEREVPPGLAWEVYYASSGLDDALAARAAKVMAAKADDEDDELEWLINEAKHLAKLGQRDRIDAVLARVGERAERWADVFYMYDALKEVDPAVAAARRAYALDPESLAVLTAYLEALLLEGDASAALVVAEAIAKAFPYQHAGPERLGLLHAQLLHEPEALEHSARAIDMAPYCHVYNDCRAVALFVAGDLDGARRHAAQSLALSAPDEPDELTLPLLVTRAVDRDADGLERCLASDRRKRDPFPGFTARLREVARRG